MRNCIRIIRQTVSKLHIVLLKFSGASIHKNVKFYGSIHVIGDERNLKIGAGTTINHNVILNCFDTVHIGENCHISAGVQLHTSYLGISLSRRRHSSKPVKIGSDTWLGAAVIVLPGVEIGNGSVIAAGQIVSQNIPSNTLVRSCGKHENINHQK